MFLIMIWNYVVDYVFKVFSGNDGIFLVTRFSINSVNNFRERDSLYINIFFLIRLS